MGIESVYRGALRVYPAQWRDRNEAAALGLLLDSAEAEGRAAADWGQVASLVANGVAARVERLAPRRWRDLAAASALIGTTAFALIDFLFFEWQPWTHVKIYPYAGVVRHLPPFSTPAVFVVVAWLAGALPWFCGARAAARALFVLAALSAVVLAVLTMLPLKLPTLLHLRSSSGGGTCCVFIAGAAFVLLGDAERRMAPLRQLGLSVAVGAAMLGLWRSSGLIDARLFTYWRRDDATLWRGWMTDADTGRLDVWLAIFYLALAAALGLGAYRVARAMLAVLGQLAAVATCFVLLSQGGIGFGDGPQQSNGEVIVMVALAALALGGACATGRPAVRRLARGIRPTRFGGPAH
ncbi:MAG TPA: hypothetical protein VGC45_16220 [Gryllotalpicola sp.]